MRARPFDVRRQTGFAAVALLCFFMLYLPIATLVVYSFNAGSSVAIWEGFSWRWYQAAWSNAQVQEASIRSLIVASFAASFATLLATMAALGTTRVRPFKGLTLIYALINQPLMVPEIVTGVALLIFFALIKVWTGYTGLAYLIVAHTAFCIVRRSRRHKFVPRSPSLQPAAGGQWPAACRPYTQSARVVPGASATPCVASSVRPSIK
jgi:spermidine/putrescine transport system permease protein